MGDGSVMDLYDTGGDGGGTLDADGEGSTMADDLWLEHNSSYIYSYYLKRVLNISEIVLSFVACSYVFFSPPLKYPDFWASIISFISSVYFFLFLIWGNIKHHNRSYYYVCIKNEAFIIPS
ncbi:uncharacterized protein Dwil_GK27871 [Drosophila willistoni]|uniref:Uncharacterized protein n=1 Tax=Drosophila willistoni TaxID=7260 RepID=A0A0Q9WYC8_DROWI|nr:uncharacterized protein Dwil_GK27871 [Drosophila willistoni]